MRLEPLYRLRFEYPDSWEADLGGESQWFFLAEGRAEGAISGGFLGANHPRRRVDGTFLPDFQAVIETDDGATILVDLRGYGRAYPEGRRQIVGFCTHLSSDERYRRLNDAVCALTGEVRREHDTWRLVIDVAELIWEPVAD